MIFALLLIANISAAALPAEPPDAATIAQQFRTVCMETRFDTLAIERRMRSLGWDVSQRADTKSVVGQQSKWSTAFGSVEAGYRVIGGVNLKTESCIFVLRDPVNPRQLEDALGLSTPFQPAQVSKRVVAKLIDLKEEQSQLSISTEIPAREAGRWKMKPGTMIGYHYANGAGAKEVGLP